MPGGQTAPSLDTLLSFHETATQAGDDAATEWARRQLEAMRSRVAEPADVARIDAACDRPEAVNPRIVARYMSALEDRDDRARSEAARAGRRVLPRLGAGRLLLPQHPELPQPEVLGVHDGDCHLFAD